MPKKSKDIIPTESIASKIIILRGERVILDRDLAEMYGVETRVLKQTVRRNIDRFPDDFMFELTKKEQDFLRSQFVTLKRGQHSKYPPFAFTEQGVAMLSSVLNSDQAIKVNISIIRTFTHLRKMIVSHEDLRGKIEAIKIQTVGFHLTSRCNDMFWSISACHVEAGSTEEKSVFVCVGLWLLENRIVFEAII